MRGGRTPAAAGLAALRSWCLLLALGWLPAPAAAQTLDRILAVVSGHVITASDVEVFLTLGLSGIERGEVDAERRVLERLIDRRLVLDEADRLLTEAPPPARVEAALEELAARFPDPEAFVMFLARSGLSPDDLRQILRDEARRESYLRDRFGPPVLAEEDLRAYYEQRPEEFAGDDGPGSFEEARPAVRRRLIALRNAEIEDWVAGLQRRAPIARFDR